MLGEKEEQLFTSALFKRAGFEANVNEHWDIEFKGVKYDVKGAKKIKRSDPEVNYRYHWVELKNVSGKPGWLYGKADFFAFELERYWCLVAREALERFVKDRVEMVYKDFPLYALYQRKGRKDLISLIPSEDLIFIGEMIPK